MFDRKTQTLVAVAVLSAAVWLVYGRSVNAPFIFDDAGSVLTNESIRRLWPPFGDADQPGPLNLPQFGATSGRPLVNLSLAVNYHWGGYNPAGYRVVNIFVHLLSAVLLGAIVRRTLELDYFGGRFDQSSGLLALAVAVLWALHPLATEAVVYVTQRTELLMALCYLATLYASVRYWTAPSPPSRTAWLTLAVFASAAGMASKEVMVSAPLVVLLFERTFLTGSFRDSLRRSWPLYAGLAATGCVLVALNYGGPRGDTAGFDRGVPLVAWWITQTKVFWMYLKLAVWPWPLAIHYEFPLASWREAWPYVVATAVLAIGSLVLLWRRHPAGFLAACVFAILAPTHVVPITTELAAERRMYLPLAALMALAVVGGYALAARSGQPAPTKNRRRATVRPVAAALVAIVLALAVVYSVASAQRLAAYRDPQMLWQQVVAVQPQNHVAQHNLGVVYMAAGRNGEAIQHYRAALRAKPDFLESRYSLGMTLAAAGELDEAIRELQQAVELKPDAYKIRNNLGVLLFTAGRLPEAIEQFQQTLRLKPDMVEAQDNLARAQQQAGVGATDN